MLCALKYHPWPTRSVATTRYTYREGQDVGVCCTLYQTELVSTEAKDGSVVIEVLYCDVEESDSSVRVSKCSPTV